MVYIGNNGKAASVSSIKVGDADGKAQNVVGGWAGDENGKARRIWSGSDAFRFKVNGSGSITFSGNVEISDGSSKKQYVAAVDETYNWGIAAKTITIRGELTNIRFNANRSLEEILSVFPASMSGVTSFSETFRGCASLTSIPAGLFDNCTAVKSFNGAFSGCTSLAAIPAGLFDNCTAVKSFYNTFNGCTSITSAVPELWDTAKWPNATNHADCFFNCANAANYANIPADWK